VGLDGHSKRRGLNSWRFTMAKRESGKCGNRLTAYQQSHPWEGER
jgi:hypothetical protein